MQDTLVLATLASIEKDVYIVYGLRVRILITHSAIALKIADDNGTVLLKTAMLVLKYVSSKLFVGELTTSPAPYSFDYRSNPAEEIERPFMVYFWHRKET